MVPKVERAFIPTSGGELSPLCVMNNRLNITALNIIRVKGVDQYLFFVMYPRSNVETTIGRTIATTGDPA